MSGGWTRSLRCALAVLACACATTPEGPIIDSFTIDGTEQLTQREVKKKLLTGASLLPWLPILGKEEHFDQNAWTGDQRRVERYYQAHGFYQAKVVRDEVVPGSKDGHVDLKLTVKEGEPTHIGRFEVTGLEALEKDQRDELLAKLPSKEQGRIFMEAEWADTQAKLKRRMLSLGYAGAFPQARAEVDVERHVADLEVIANLGQRYKFGKVIVTDPDGQVNTRLISDQVESVIEEGEWFNPEDLEEAQARVFNMGVFSAVKVTRAALDQSTGVAPVTVDVREAPFTTWRVGGGIGADPLRDEVRASVLYENRNFLGGTRRLTLRGRAGYAALAGSSSSGLLAILSVAAGQPGSQHGPFGSLAAEIEQPHFLTRLLSIALTVEPAYLLEPAYRAGGGSARFAFIARPSSHLTATLSANLSIFQLSGPVGLGSTTTRFVACGITCVLAYLEQTVTYDRRDDPLEPHVGFYGAVSFQEGGNSLASGQFALANFFRVLPEARGYYSFFDNKLTFAARARLGLLFTATGAAPIAVRFFSGGNDMRGFSSRRLAPYEVVPRGDCKTLGVDPLVATAAGTCPGYGEALPVGGNTLLDGTFEIRWNLWGDLTIATFVDVGFVSNAGLGIQLFRALNMALGLGLRYRTAIGPIRLDLAYRLPMVGSPLEQGGRNLPHAVSRGCFFGLGAGQTDVYAGSPEGQCAFHLSIGEAF